MRRITTFFLSLLLSLVATTAMADTFEDGYMIKIGEPATQLVEGQYYLIYSLVDGYLYDRGNGTEGRNLYASDGTSVVKDGMVANDIKNYLVSLTTGDDGLGTVPSECWIAFADGLSLNMYDEWRTSWLTSYGNFVNIFNVCDTEDYFAIMELTGESGRLLTTYYDQEGACASSSDANRQVTSLTDVKDMQCIYQFIEVEIVEPFEVQVDPGKTEPGEWSEIRATKSDICIDSIAANQWCMVYCKGSSSSYQPAYWHENTSYGALYTQTASTVETQDVRAEDLAPYLVRFIPTGEESQYYVQLGTGNYLSLSDEDMNSGDLKNKQVKVSSDIVDAIQVYGYYVTWDADTISDPDDIKDEDFYMAFNVQQAEGDTASWRIAAYGSNQYVYLWNHDKASYDSNMSNHFWIYPVSFVDPYVVPEDTDSDYHEGDVVAVDGVEYTVLDDNEIENHSFELGFEGWTKASDFTTTIDEDFELLTDNPQNGLNYLVGTSTSGVSSTAGAAGTSSLGTAWPIEAGETYMFTYWIKQQNEGEDLELNYLKVSLTNTPGTETEVFDQIESLGTEWQMEQIVFTNDEGYEYLQIDFRWLKGRYGFDNFSLHKVEVAAEEPEIEPVDLVAHSETAEFDHWSTTGNNGTLQYNSWSTESDASGMKTPFIENWVNASSGTLTAATISHKTLVGLPAGDYEVSLDIRILNETGNAVGTGTTFNANGESVDLVEAGTTGSYSGSPEVYGTYTVACEVGDDGLLDICIEIPDDATYNWIAFKNLAVTMHAEGMPEVVAIEGAMGADAKAAMEEAIGTYNDDPTEEHFTAAIDAIQDAQVSIEEYADIAALVDALDEDGRAAWDETESGVAYNAGTLNTSADYSADMATAQKAQTTEGSDMTFVAMYDGTWIGQTGTYHTDYIERYEEYEYSEGKILYKQIEGLAPGNYTVTFLAVANSAWIGSTAGSNIAQVFVNDVCEDVLVYSQVECVPTDYEHTMTAEVGSDGILEFGLQNVGSGGNWYVAQAVSMTLGGTITEVEVKGDYEFVNEQWVSLDLGRVTQDNISYQLNDNTITVNAGTGANNVAIGNSESYTADGPFTTEEYTVGISQNWFIVVGTNLSVNAGDSYLWWMNGTNKNTQVAPTMIIGLEDGEILFAWDLSESGLDDNLQDRLNYLNGWTGFGLTSTTGTSVISDICFYTWDDAVETYPELVTGGIEVAISNVEATTESGAIFDLSGRKVSKAIKGIYIIDGKKVLVK